MANIDITGDPRFSGAYLAESPETCVNAGNTLSKIIAHENHENHINRENNENDLSR